jgi:hypothetical protein
VRPARAHARLIRSKSKMTSIRPSRLFMTGCVIVWLCGGIVPSSQEPAAQTEVRRRIAGAQRTSLAAAAHGPLVVLGWFSSERPTRGLTIVVSEDGGRKLGQPRVASAEPSVTGGKPALAILPSSTGSRTGSRPRIVAAWPATRNGESGVVAVASSDLGRSFETAFFRPIGLPAKAALSALAVGQSGELHTLWSVDSLLFYGRSGGEPAFPTRQLDESASRCGVSAVAVGTDNSVSVMWYRSFGKGDEEFAYARSGDRGEKFSAPLRVSRERWGFQGCPGASPSLSVDMKGDLRFAFQAVAGGNPPLSSFYTDRSSDGRTFRPRAYLDTLKFAEVRSPRLLPDGDGGLALAWDGIRNDRRYVMIRHSLGAPGGAGGLDADWMRPGPPIVLDHTGRGADAVVARIPGGVLAAWLTGSPDSLSLVARRLGIDELCGLPSGNR